MNISVSKGRKVFRCRLASISPTSTTFSTATLTVSFTVSDSYKIYYTKNGSTPNSSKTLYTGPFIINATTTIKWISVKTNYKDSAIQSVTITKV